MDRRWLAGLTFGCLLAAGPQALAAPTESPRGPGRQPGTPPRFDRTFQMEGQEEMTRLCAEKVVGTLPFTAIPAADLALDAITLHTESGYYTVLVSLLRPVKHIERVIWDADTIEEVTTFVRLLQSGKIKTVKVKAFDDEFVPDAKRKAPAADLEACTGDGLRDLLAPCRDCRVVEWVFGKSPID